jgi:hypothetical protein
MSDDNSVGNRIRRGFKVLTDKFSNISNIATEMDANAKKNAEPIKVAGPIKIIDEAILGDLAMDDNGFFDLPGQDKKK